MTIVVSCKHFSGGSRKQMSWTVESDSSGAMEVETEGWGVVEVYAKEWGVVEVQWICITTGFTLGKKTYPYFFLKYSHPGV